MIRINVNKVLKEQEAKKKEVKPLPKIRIIRNASIPKEKPVAKQPVQEKEPESPNELLEELEAELADIKKQRGKISSSIYKAVHGRNSDLCIDIGTVLNKIDNTVDDETMEVRRFGIRYLTENGKGEMLDCRKNVKDPFKNQKGKTPEKGKFKYSLKQKGTILLTSEEKAYRSVLVSTIYEFKDFKSSRWIRVRH